jgi:protein ImuB
MTKELPLASATSDSDHLMSIIEPIVEGLNFFGEVRELSLLALQIESTSSEQRDLCATYQTHATTKARNELMNNFSLRIGKDRIAFAKLSPSYIPERSFCYESVLNSGSTDSLMHSVVPYNLEERPSVLLPRPEPISTIAMLPDKPPSFICWRGKRLSIISGLGPERISPEWWRPGLQSGPINERDYFKVQDELGRWLWVYRDLSSQEWFLHGMWS